MQNPADVDWMALIHKVVANYSTATVILVATGLGWLIGVNILVALHYRRLGRPPWSGFRPFAFPFKDFNAFEWICLIALIAACMSIMSFGISLNAR